MSAQINTYERAGYPFHLCCPITAHRRPVQPTETHCSPPQPITGSRGSYWLKDSADRFLTTTTFNKQIKEPCRATIPLQLTCSAAVRTAMLIEWHFDGCSGAASILLDAECLGWGVPDMSLGNHSTPGEHRTLTLLPDRTPGRAFPLRSSRLLRRTYLSTL